MQEEHEAPAAKRVCRNGSVSITLSDSDVLDCPICYGPFTAPVYQVCLFFVFFFKKKTMKKSECLHNVVSGAIA